MLHSFHPYKRILAAITPTSTVDQLQSIIGSLPCQLLADISSMFFIVFWCPSYLFSPILM